jgi:hypothetical protein
MSLGKTVTIMSGSAAAALLLIDPYPAGKPLTQPSAAQVEAAVVYAASEAGLADASADRTD